MQGSNTAGVSVSTPGSSSSEVATEGRRTLRDRTAKPNYTGEKIHTSYFTAAPSPTAGETKGKTTAKALHVALSAAAEVAAECASEEGETPDPRSYREAMSRPSSEGWSPAMDEEMSAHKRNNTWTLVDRPPGAVNVIGNKWVYKTKYKQTPPSPTPVRERLRREVARRKARLVAQGFGQKEGVDFFETFAPTLKYVTLRLMLCIAAVLGLFLKQLDVTTAYLQAPMKERVYMKQPVGYEDESRPDAVCLLNMSIYGTKQAGHNWNQLLDSFVTQVLGYSRTESDPCLYWRRSATGQLMLLGVFVDDLLHAHSPLDDAEWEQLKAKFLRRFPSTDSGDVSVLLGMRITRDVAKGSLFIDQQSYVQQIIKNFGMENCKPADTPARPGVRLTQRKSEENNFPNDPSAAAKGVREYQQIVGSLLYAAITTRADIMHAVAQLTRFMTNPGEQHWEAAFYVIRYLRGTSGVRLHYRYRPSLHQSNNTVQPTDSKAGQQFTTLVWCDADWAQCEESRRSTSGVLVQLFGCSVLWLSKRQPTVSLSSTEAEYMALGQGVREVQWFHSLLEELQLRAPQTETSTNDDEEVVQLQEEHRKEKEKEKEKEKQKYFFKEESSEQSQFDSQCVPPSTLLTDNQSALALVHQRGAMASRSKHIAVRHHHIREVVSSGEARVEWVPTAEQLADTFTKALDKISFIRLRGKIMGDDDDSQLKYTQRREEVSRPSTDHSRLPATEGIPAAAGSQE